MKRNPIVLSALLLPLLSVTDQGGAALRVQTLEGETLEVSDPKLVAGNPARLEGTQADKPWSSELPALWKIDNPRSGTTGYARDTAKAFFQLRGSSSIEGKLVGGDPADPKWFKFKMPGGKEGLVLRHHLLALRSMPVRKPVPKDPNAAVVNGNSSKSKGKATQGKKDEPAKPAIAEKTLDGGFAKALANPPENRDLIFVEDNKKRVRSYACDVRGVDDEGVSIEFRGQTRSLPLSRVYGIVFGALSGVKPEFKGVVSMDLRLSDGRAFRGRLRDMDRTSWSLSLADKLDVSFPLTWIKEATIASDRCVYVSDLEIKDRIQKPMLGREWPILKNHAGGGKPLDLGGSRWRKGFVLVPDVSFRVDFPKPYSRLLGQVGMPKAMVGSAVLRFLVKGEQIGSDYKLEANGKLTDIDLDLRGAKELSLELEHSVDLDAGARVFLGDLRAINTQ